MAGCHRSVDLLVYSLACLFACLLACLLAWYFFWGGGLLSSGKFDLNFGGTNVNHNVPLSCVIQPCPEMSFFSPHLHTRIFPWAHLPPPFGANSTIQFNNPIQKHPSTERPSMNQQNWSDSIDERFIIVNKRNDPSGRIEVTPNGHC